MTNYGSLDVLVKAVGALVAAGAAIALGFRGRASWEPSEQDLSMGSQRVGSLLSVIGIAWVFFTMSRGTPPTDYDALQSLALQLGVGCLISLVIYGLLISQYTYRAGPETDAPKLVGGFWTYAHVRAQLKSPAASDDTPPNTLQDVLARAGYDPDRVWPRIGRGLAKQSFVLAYIALTATGTIALTVAAALILPRNAPPPRIEPWRPPPKADERAALRREIRERITEYADPFPSSAIGSAWRERVGPKLGLQPESSVRSSELQDRLIRWQNRLSAWTHACEPDATDCRPPTHPRCRFYPETFGTNPISHQDSLVIGSIFKNYTHSNSERAVALAVEEVNQAHGVANRSVVLAACTSNEEAKLDNLSQLDAVSATARYLVDQLNVPIIIGSDTSETRL